MTSTEQDLRKALQRSSAAAPLVSDRFDAVERRVRGRRRRTAAVVAVVAASALVAVPASSLLDRRSPAETAALTAADAPTVAEARR